MASVFKNEMNWSSYQDKQLNVLLSLEKSFNSSLNMSKAIESNLSQMQNAMASLTKALSSLAESTITSAKKGKSSSRNKATELAMKNLREYHATEMKLQEDRHKQSEKFLEDQVRAAREELELVNERRKNQEQIKQSLEGIFTRVFEVMGTIGKVADNYSTTSNQMIKISGESGIAVRDFRSDFIDIVKYLNRDTGNAYSPQESYASIVSLSQGVTGSLDAIKEMSRPLLLASEALDANLSNITELFNRFYVRYSFNSNDMEELVDDIRGYTAGNSASAEAALKNVDILEKAIAVNAGGDKDLISEATEEVIAMSARLESMGIEDSTKYGSDIKNLMDGVKSAEYLNPILSNADYKLLDVSNLAKDLKVEEVGDILNKAYNKFYEDFIIDQTTGKESVVASSIAENFKQDLDFLRENHIAMENYVSPEDFIPGTSTPEDAADDQYHDPMEQANYWLESIYGTLADWQEKSKLGGLLSFSNAANVYATVKSIQGFTSLFKGVSGAGGTASQSSSLLRAASALRRGDLLSKGTLLASNPAATTALGYAGLAGGVAGLGLGAYGIGSGISDWKQGDKGVGAASIAGGVAAGAGGVMLLASNPVGWAVTLAGGLTIGAAKLVKSMTPVSGAAKTLEKEFDNLIATSKDEHEARQEQIISIMESISETEDFEEAQKLAISAGVDPLQVKAAETTDELKNLISALMESENSLYSLEEAALNASKSLMKDKAEKEDKEVAKALNQAIKDKSTTLNSDFGYAMTSKDDNWKATKAMFENLAGTITDEKARDKAMKQIEKAFKDGILTMDELDVLTNQGGWGVRKSTFSQERDIATTAATLDSYGYYDIASMYTVQDDLDKVSDLVSIYNSWMKDKDNEDYIKDFNETYKSITDEDLKNQYEQMYKAINGTMTANSSYAVGTNYITSDQIAYLHEGEAVVPKKYNPMANLNELEMLREQSRKSQENNKKDSDQSQEYLKASLEVIQEIKEFLSYWREDNIKREKTSEAKSKFSSNSRYVSGYTTRAAGR